MARSINPNGIQWREPHLVFEKIFLQPAFKKHDSTREFWRRDFCRRTPVRIDTPCPVRSYSLRCFKAVTFWWPWLGWWGLLCVWGDCGFTNVEIKLSKESQKNIYLRPKMHWLTNQHTFEAQSWRHKKLYFTDISVHNFVFLVLVMYIFHGEVLGGQNINPNWHKNFRKTGHFAWHKKLGAHHSFVLSVGSNDITFRQKFLQRAASLCIHK